MTSSLQGSPLTAAVKLKRTDFLMTLWFPVLIRERWKCKQKNIHTVWRGCIITTVLDRKKVIGKRFG